MKILCSITITVFLILNVFGLSTTHAKIKTYEGTGLFVVVDETLNYAKNQAKLNAIRHIAEEICVYIQSNTEIENSQIRRDEIIVTTESLIRVIDVKYDIYSSSDESFIICAIVTAEVDTDEVEKLLNQKEAN